MGHASFSPETQNVVCTADQPYYAVVSHSRANGHDHDEKDPKTIIDGVSPSNDKRFGVDTSWESQISESWTKTFKFEGIFLGSVTIKHWSYYQVWKKYQYKSKTDWRSATFNIWLPSLPGVSYDKWWKAADKTIFITINTSSSEKLDEIIGKQISIYNYEPLSKATLGAVRWERISDTKAKLYLEIGYNFSFRNRIIKISAGTTNLCTIVQKENTNLLKNIYRFIKAEDGSQKKVFVRGDNVSSGFLSEAVFITSGKVEVSFNKNVSFIESYPVYDFSPEEEIVPDNDISLIDISVGNSIASFSSKMKEYYDYCRGVFVFSDGSSVFACTMAIQCENEFLQGGTNFKIDRTFFNINYNKDVKPTSISIVDKSSTVSSSKEEFEYWYYGRTNTVLKNPIFLLLGYKDYSPVFSFVFNGTNMPTTYYSGRFVGVYGVFTDIYEIHYSDGTKREISIRYHAGAYRKPSDELTLFASGENDGGEIKKIPSEDLDIVGKENLLLKRAVPESYRLLYKGAGGETVIARMVDVVVNKFPRTLRNIDKGEMTSVLETPIMFPISGVKYYADDNDGEATQEVAVFYGLRETATATVEFEVKPLYKEYGSEIISAEAFCYSVEPRGGYYNNIVETEVEKRDGRFFVIIKARQTSYMENPHSLDLHDSTSTWGIRWTENEKSPISVTSKKRVRFLFYRGYPLVFETTIVSLNGIKGSTFAYLDKSTTSTPYRVRVKSSRFSSSLVGFSFVESVYRKKISATLIEHDEKTNEWEYELLAVPSSSYSNTVACFVNATFEFGNMGIKTTEASYKYNRPAIRRG